MMVNNPKILAELEALNMRYESALMANDLEELDAMFWQGPHVVRLGVGENLYGTDEIAAFRRDRPGGSPKRTVLRTSISAFGTDFGLINIEFQREGGTAVGRQSQTWVRLPEGWRVVAAHVSLMAGGH